MVTPPPGLFCPFDFPSGQTYALGLTYAAHRRETAETGGKPVVFIKSCAASAGLIEARLPSQTDLAATLTQLDPELARWLGRRFGSIPALFDYEIELGIVLLDDMTEADLGDGAPMPQIGYFLANDLTVRSVQIAGEGRDDRLRFWAASKSFPGFLPVSSSIWCPAAPSGDLLPDLRLRTIVNGTVRQDESTRDIIYTPRQMLRLAADASPDRRLRRHDLVLTGTPAGVAFSVPRWKRRLATLLPRRLAIAAAWRGGVANDRFLKPGDQVVMQADWLGSLDLRVVRATD